MEDLEKERALSLCYYNLAYSIPYLHISLKTDSEKALAFWWYASTCRHLGVGGKSANPSVSMRTYLLLKRFYTQGVFYGLEETVHAHTLPGLRKSVDLRQSRRLDGLAPRRGPEVTGLLK